MSIRVLFFASIREAAGSAEIEIQAEHAISLEELMSLLADRLPEAGMAAISAENVRVAVNQTLGGDRSAGMRIGPDDEVAFLPPVTGG